jgi:branched-chain amino acid aminotransferase
VARYSEDQGWYQAEVRPYGPLELDPAAAALHYGQALFVGMKAFRKKDGKIAVLRPDFNWRRLHSGAERLAMIAPPIELCRKGLQALLRLDQGWIPSVPGTSLYIRPTLIASEPFLGIRKAREFLFMILLSPVGFYYAGSSDAVKIWVEDKYIRAAPGGLGATKAGANYAGSLKASILAKEKGYTQVLWLDVNRKYIEEVGTMNVFFVINDEVVTPALNGTILEGNTRDMAIELLRQFGYKISERPVTLTEILRAAESDQLEEAFGTGTAVVISPISELASDDFKIDLLKRNPDGWGPVAKKLYQSLTGIQTGEVPDVNGWLEFLPPVQMPTSSGERTWNPLSGPLDLIFRASEKL